ncbi:MAG: beta strand repeat-containing protein, partial [Vogesella sp.]|uniref:beta strand repeat-containing protein n=1 Tax=Vogesella sp. TaxID=1904252 RepID=UPI003F417AE0
DTKGPALTSQLDPASDSGTKGDGITNDNTPTISGTGEPGSTVTITTPTGETVSTTVKPDGSWSATPTQPLPEGNNTVTVKATDPAGNSTTGTVPVTVDTKGPVLTSQLDPASDSGTKGDGVTNDNTPTISGTGEPGSTVIITTPTGETVSTTVKPDGSWSATPTQPLPEGNNTVTVKATDPAGNSTTGTVPVTVDTKGPALTSQLDPASDSGTKGDGITNDNTPTISGTGEPGSTVTITTPTGETVSTTVKPDGSWSATPTQPLPEGNNTVTVKATDPAGNSTTGTVPLVVDSAVPNGGQAPEVTLTEDGNNDGFINRTEAQGDADVKVAFNRDLVSVGDVVQISAGGVSKNVTISATDKQNGYVTSSFALPASGDTLTVNAQIVDAAGNRSATGSDSAKVDLSNLNVPVVSIVEDTNNDGLLNKVELQGLVGVVVSLPAGAVAGDLLTIQSTGSDTKTITLTQAQIDAGRVTLEVPPTVSGTDLVVTAQLSDAAGNQSDKTSAKVKIDTEAPALTAQLDPASDTGTKGDSLTNDNTPTISGTGEAGNKVTVTTPTGETLTTTVQPDGTWTVTPSQPLPDGSNTVTVKATDPAGNTSTANVPLVIDTSKPALTAQLDPASDSGAKGDGITNDNTPTIMGTGEPGNTITVTTPSGETLTTTVKPDGSWSVTPTQPLPEGSVNLQVTATDPAGNTTNASVPLTIDTAVPNAGAAPVVTLTEDSNNDGFINRAEAQGEADVSIAFNRSQVAVGDQLVVSNGTSSKTITLTAGDIAAGAVNTSVPLPASGNTLTVDAYFMDAAGNRSASGSDSAKVDLSDLSGLQVAITEDANNDGIINSSELQGNVGVSISLPAGAVAGDLLTITSSGNATQTIVLTQPQVDARQVLLDLPAPANGSELLVTAQLSDAAGNQSNTASDKATLMTGEPGAPQVRITEDSNNDGLVSTAELNGTLDTLVTLPATAQAGDKLLVTVNGVDQPVRVLTAADIAAGAVSLAGINNPGDGATVNVSARIEDKAGNLGPAGSDSVKMDLTQFTGLAIRITEDENNDGLISAGELKDNDIDVRVTLPQGAVPGDSLSVSASGNVAQVFTLTAAQLAAGFIDVSFNPTANNTDFVVTANITDVAGNRSGPVTDMARLQLSAPGVPVVNILEDQNNDGFINVAEKQGSVDVSVTLPATAQVGDKLLVSVDGVAQTPRVLTAQDIAKGSVVVDNVSQPAEGGTLTVTAQVEDKAGNLGGTGSDSAKLDTVAPVLTAGLDPASDSGTVGDGITNDNTPTISGTGEPGNSIKVTSPTGEVLTTTVKPDGTWSVTPTQPLPEGAANLPVVATDPAGNTTTASVPLTIDTQVPNNGNPVGVAIVEDSNDDGLLNRAEAQGDVDVKVSFNGNLVAVGDTVSINNGTLTQTVAITAQDKASGFVTTSFPPLADGATLVVKASIVDAAGNRSGEGQDTVKADYTQFSGMAVRIVEDENNDGLISASELKDNDLDVQVTLPAGAAVGDTVTVTGSGNVNQVFILTAQQIADGVLNVSFNPTANNTDFVTTVSIVDPAGNKAGPVQDTALLQLTAPGLPIVTITTDQNNDGYINASELTGNIAASVTLPATAAQGDKLVYSINGVTQPPLTLTQADIVAGSVSLPGIASPGEGKDLVVTAQVVDKAGNEGGTGSDSVKIDTTAPALTAKLDPASDSGTPGDGITNDTTPTISGTGNVGDSIKVTTPTGEVLTTTVKPDGTWSVTPTQPLPEGAANLPVVATDP